MIRRFSLANMFSSKEKETETSTFTMAENSEALPAEESLFHASKITPAFTRLVNLAGSQFGSKVVFSTDDWFTPAQCLIKQEIAEKRPNTFTEYGAWMDGWESRRKRTEGHDWAIIKLGLQGTIEGVDIDTSHFTGNFPPRASVQAAYIEESPTFENTRGSDKECITPGKMGEKATEEEFKMAEQFQSSEWETIVPMVELGPGFQETAHNFFAVHSKSAGKRFTHVRLNIFPDGGVARFRVHGRVQLDWSAKSREEEHDMVSAMNGGTAVDWSDAHFGSPSNIVNPGRGINMGDGWETARKRDRGPILQKGEDGMIVFRDYDWAVLRLATKSKISRVVVDTIHFKGNFPESCEILATCYDGKTDPSFCKEEDDDDDDWFPLLSRQQLTADAIHEFQGEKVADCGEITHVCVKIFPDGGISRLQLWGTPCV